MQNNIKKIYNLLSSILPILFITGCATRYHHTDIKERNSLKKVMYQQTGYDVLLNRESIFTNQSILDGITRDDAVSMALMAEPTLYAQLETLGISKADFIQSGFLSNPRIDTIFQYPRRVGEKGCIELDVTMTISDLWQIPMRKKVAQDKLAITSTALLQKILSVISDAKKAYNLILFEAAQLQATIRIFETVKELRDRIYQRQCAGFSSDFETNFAEVAVGDWQIEVIKQQSRLKMADINLRNTIGLRTTADPIKTLDILRINHTLLNNPFALVEYAKQNKPETHINRLKIQQAQHQRALEKCKIINNVDFGIRFNRETDGSKLTGPSIGFEMPFFDWNQAQIAKTRYEEKMARYELDSSCANIEVNVQQLCMAINAQIETIDVYTNRIVPHSEQALDYSKRFASNMQLEFITMLNAEVELYKQELKLNQEYLDLWQNVANLEMELGGYIPSFAD